jgi:hypothetical protein
MMTQRYETTRYEVRSDDGTVLDSAPWREWARAAAERQTCATIIVQVVEHDDGSESECVA